MRISTHSACDKLSVVVEDVIEAKYKQRVVDQMAQSRL